MHYFSDKFSKFDFGDLKLRDFAKLCFFELIMTKSNFKKSVMTTSLLRHGKTSPNYRHNIFTFCPPPNQNFWLRQRPLIMQEMGQIFTRIIVNDIWSLNPLQIDLVLIVVNH